MARKKMVYEWGRRSYPVPAQTVGEAVQAIADREGYCSPSRLVDEANKEQSPLHPLFTWNDEAAAALWRNHEARQLINGLVVSVTVQGETVQAPAFISVGHTKRTQGSGEGYRPVSVVTSTPEYSEEALAEAVSRLQALRRRYDAIEALTPVWRALDRIAS